MIVEPTILATIGPTLLRRFARTARNTRGGFNKAPEITAPIAPQNIGRTQPRKARVTTEPKPTDEKPLNERKKRLVTSGADSGIAHRAGITDCPHCKFEPGRTDDGDKLWDKAGHTLVLQPRVYKSGCVVVVSECPKCFESSWVHIRMSGFDWNDCWPKKWKEAVAKEDVRVRLEAAREWPTGLCWRCKHLTSATIEYHAWRHCIVGSGSTRTKCEKFQQLNP